MWFFAVGMIILCSVLLYEFHKFNKDSVIALNNPIQFAVDRYSDVYGKDASCSCQINGQFYTFTRESAYYPSLDLKNMDESKNG